MEEQIIGILKQHEAECRPRTCAGSMGSARRSSMAGSRTAISTIAREPGQKTSTTPEEAGKALYSAAKADGKDAIPSLLGPSANGIVSSGHDVRKDDAVYDTRTINPALCDFIRFIRLSESVTYRKQRLWKGSTPVASTNSFIFICLDLIYGHKINCGRGFFGD